MRPDVVLSCGDLPFDYLEFLVSRVDVPLLYVPGNHDPDLGPVDTTWMPLSAEPPSLGPPGCQNIDGRLVDADGLHIAGLGGSLRYRKGANQYSEAEMSRRVLKLGLRIRLKRMRRARKLDVLVTHAPPFGVAPMQDAAHTGFVAFARMIRSFQPALAVHGHVHPYGRKQLEGVIGSTRVVNAVPSRLIEL